MTTPGRLLVALGVLWAGTCCDVHAARHVGASAKHTGKGARCGNARVEPGETCDDGNTKDGDYCPSNCRIETCKPTAERLEVSVTLVRPKDLGVGGVVVLLDYPEGAVSLPGSIGEPSVGARISHLPKDFASAPFDLDYALRETVLMNRPLPRGEIFRVAFDRCEGASRPPEKDFTCRVEEASTPGGQSVPAASLSCTVKVL